MVKNKEVRRYILFEFENQFHIAFFIIPIELFLSRKNFLLYAVQLFGMDSGIKTCYIPSSV